MGADLAADAVLERRDDLPARGVVLRVRGEDHADVDGQPHRVALDLHVPLLEDVEEAHLDAPREVGQLVEGEDPPVRPRQQAVVHGQLAGEVEPSARGPDRVHVADDVGDGHVGRRELLDVALVRREPGDRGGVALLGEEVAAALAQRPEGVVVDLAPRDHRRRRVEQAGEAAQDPALRLAPQAQQDHVVPRQHGVDELGDDGVVVAHDAGEDGRARLELAQQVAAHLLLHRDTLRGTRHPQLSEGPGLRHGEGPPLSIIGAVPSAGRRGAAFHNRCVSPRLSFRASPASLSFRGARSCRATRNPPSAGGSAQSAASGMPRLRAAAISRSS